MTCLTDYTFKRRIEIGNRFVGDGEHCFVAAEIGLNHNGDIQLAKSLINTAAECGADAVKFQKRCVDAILTEEYLEKPYDVWYSYGKTYGAHRRALEFSDKEFKELKEYSDGKGILFYASAWDEDSADLLESMDSPAYKIASACVTDLPLIHHIAKKGKPVILSAGMSTVDELKEAVDTVAEYNDELIILHCVSTYPSEYGEINLNNMRRLRELFDCPIGYSGHERGIAVSEAAVALGACMVERHFTLDRAMKGPDHAASLEPPGLSKLVRDIKNIERAMVSFEMRIQDREIPVRDRLAKSVVAAIDIPVGTIITDEMLAKKSPARGLPPKYITILPGKRAKTNIKKDAAITREMVEMDE
jgi:sialic acid synthase SpsE